MYSEEYQTTGISLPAFALTPDESKMFFLPTTNPMTLVTISPSNGLITNWETYSLVQSLNAYSVLITDPSSSNLYFGVQNSNPYCYIWKLAIGGSTLTCWELNGLNDFRTLSYLDQDYIY